MTATTYTARATVRATVEYTEAITAEVAPPAKGFTTIGRKKMTCEVEITLDLERLAKKLGYKACTSKGGRSQEADGCLVVKRVAVPRELSREMFPS